MSRGAIFGLMHCNNGLFIISSGWVKFAQSNLIAAAVFAARMLESDERRFGSDYLGKKITC